MLNEQRNPASTAIEKKLERAARDLDTKLSVGRAATRDEIFGAVNESLREFYRALREPQTQDMAVRFLDRLSPTELLTITRAIIADIEFGYDRVREQQEEVVRRANRFNSLARVAQQRITYANNEVGSISRVSEENRFEISDSFNDVTLLEAEGSSLFVQQTAGALTLPQIATSNVQVAKIEILNSSNGLVAQNHPVTNAVDDNADTWFEFIRSGDVDDQPLILELLLTLRTVNVVNQISVTPLTRDDRAFAVIEEISTSLDGRTFRNIRDSFPTLLSKDEEDALFTLGPVGFRNQAAADFILTPRTIQYIKVRIRQGKKVQLLNSTQLRIAIQDVAIQSVEYETEGEIHSKTFSLPFEARELLITERSADTAPLTDIFYQVSFDNGGQYFDIAPDEPFNVNTGATGAAEVATSPTSVKLRIIQRRDKTQFNGLARPLAETIKTVSQRLTVPSTPLDISLKNVPLEDTLAIYRPIFAVGQDFGLPLFKAQGEDSLAIDLPGEVEAFSESVRINGEKWTRVNTLSNSGPDDRHYTISYANKQIKFGDSKNSIAPQGEITLELDPERLQLPDTSPFRVTLNHAHDFNTENTEVEWYDRPRRSAEEFLATGANEFQLANYPITRYQTVTELVPAGQTTFYLESIPIDNATLVFSDTKTFATRVYSSPSAAGEYQMVPLISGFLSPLQILTFGLTDANAPGTIQFNAKAKIIDPESSYNVDRWQKNIGVSLENLSGVVIPFFPEFSDTTVFAEEKVFIDGSTELEGAGDYSVDDENGKLYSFSDTADTGLTHTIYSYQNKRALDWGFTSEADQLLINDESFLVNRNDQFPAAIVISNIRYYTIFKNRRYINIPVDTVSPYFDPGITEDIEFVASDYVRGATLIAGRTRIKLDHQSIIQNSVRFVFLSDDINAFNDRIVSTSATGIPIVSPRPIKDIFGDALTAEVANLQTQRDVDRESLTTEKVFINGHTELEIGGDYSIDYKKGILYTFTPIPEHTIIQYEFADVRASYIATRKLVRGDSYTVDPEALQVKLTGIGGTDDFQSTDLLVRYEIIDQLKEDPIRVLRFFSPILLGYTLRVKP
jgi:hypothetical protein